MRLSKKKRIRRKQVKRKMKMAEKIIRFFSAAMEWHQKRSVAISAAHKFPSGGLSVEGAMGEFVAAAEKVVGKGAVESGMFGSPLNEGNGWAESAHTQIIIDPDLKTEFTVTSKGFKGFCQQKES